jgi:hypothetical protein
MELLHQYTYGGGVVTQVGTTEADGGKLVIKKWQDDTASRNFATAMGADEGVWKAGVKKSWAMAGHIPDITVVELRQIGVDVFTAPLKEIRAGLRKLGKESFIWKT